MIEIKNISKSFNDKQVLFNISGKFIKGRTNLIIGASGTGKSVLLKCMVGLLSPDTGKVLFDGRKKEEYNFFAEGQKGYEQFAINYIGDSKLNSFDKEKLNC